MKDITENGKYYTPQIEEFHVGFEYQWRDKYEDLDVVWENAIIKDGTQIDDIQNDIYELRVKHLDNDDIIECGWLLDSDIDKTISFFSLIGDISKYKLCMISDTVADIFENDNTRIFLGYIKNKSELKRIMQQVGINDNLRYRA